MNYTLAVLFGLLYNFAIVAGTVFLIVFYDWSPWWFILTALLLVTIERKKE